MTADRIQTLCPDAKRINGKRIYNLQKRLERFKRYTKRKDDIVDIGPLIKEETITETKWNRKEKKIQKDFHWALGPEATHQITRSEYGTEPDKIKIDQRIKLYNRYHLPKRNIQLKRRFLRPLGEIDQIRTKMRFSRM